MRGLELSALRGTYWVVIFYGLSMALRLGSSIVLSRLFLPQYFGLMTLITTVIVGINLFSHVGLQESIIQDPRGDVPVFLHTAWTLQVIRGLGLFLLTIPLAWPVAHFYREPQIVVLLPCLGLVCLLAGFSSPEPVGAEPALGSGQAFGAGTGDAVRSIRRHLDLGTLPPYDLGTHGGKVMAEVCRTGISYLLLPEVRARFTWDKESVHALVKFGRWILIGTALTFLALQSDRLILAKLISFQMLGVYGIAFALSDIPRQIILMFCSRVGFPFIAKFSDQPRPAFRQILLKYRLPVLAAGGLMLIAVICTGDLFILHVYTKPYHDAAWMIPDPRRWTVAYPALQHDQPGDSLPAKAALQRPRLSGVLHHPVHLLALGVSCVGNGRRGHRGRLQRLARLFCECLQRVAGRTADHKSGCVAYARVSGAAGSSFVGKIWARFWIPLSFPSPALT